MSPTIFAVLLWCGCWALFRIGFPRGVINKRDISALRRLYYQGLGTILVPIIVVVLMWDWGLSPKAMGAGAILAVLVCLGLYWAERRRRSRPRKKSAV